MQNASDNERLRAIRLQVPPCKTWISGRESVRTEDTIPSRHVWRNRTIRLRTGRTLPIPIPDHCSIGSGLNNATSFAICKDGVAVAHALRTTDMHRVDTCKAVAEARIQR